MGMREIFTQRKGREAAGPDAPNAREIATLPDHERLALLDSFEQTGIGWFWATDESHRLVYLSPGAQAQIPRERTVIGETLGVIIETVSEDGAGSDPRPLSFLLNAHTSFAERPVRLAGSVSSHETFWSLTGKPQFDKSGNFKGYRGSAKDITISYREMRDSQRMAQFDSLTGLANRHRMESRLEAMLTAMCPSGRSCAIMMLDLDRFKQVNDTMGHPAGDELLRQVAQRLREVVAGNAEIGRLGGDEFQILLPDTDDRGRLGELAERIVKLLSQPFVLEEGRATIGASVGIAVAPFDGEKPEQIVKAADLALYASKGGGRGQYRFFSEDLKDVADDQRELEERLAEAIEREELEMHYQPIVDAETNKVHAFEALMRWNHPVRGILEAERFIPVAEQVGLIDRLGEWGLQKACEDAAKWPGDIRVCVNISSRQFVAPELPQIVQRALTQAELEPKKLELEISEGVFMGDQVAVEDMFAALKAIGLSLALDDFGVGFSNIAFLRGAPFSRIKIHPSFVSGCTERENANTAIITAFVSLAEALGMQTTAEGVEVLDEFDLIKELKVDFIQGFIFSRPVPQAEVLEKLSSGNFLYEPSGPRKYRAERRSTFRRIGVIHGDYRYEAMLRNISRTGALIEGLLDVPVGTELVLDLGEGQLAVATVRRSQDASQGVEFETPLISDGADGLCTRHRVSPYILAANGMGAVTGNGSGERRFMQVNVSAGSSRAA